MKIFGVAGWSGSGKTTLLARLIPALRDRGLEVATVKHTHHHPSVGGGDDLVLLEAGAAEVLTASSRRFALMRAFPPAAEPPLAELIPRFRGVDLLLIEGFKWAPHPKIEVWDPALGKEMLAPREASIVALAADGPVAGLSLPRFSRNDTAGIAAFVAEFSGL